MVRHINGMTASATVGILLGTLLLSWLIAPNESLNRVKLAWQQFFPAQENAVDTADKNEDSQVNASKPQELEITPDLSKPTPSDLNLEELSRLEGNPTPSPAPVAPNNNTSEVSPSQSVDTPSSNSNLSRALLPSLAPPPSSSSSESSELPYSAATIPQEGTLVPQTPPVEVVPEPKSSQYYYVVVPYKNSNSLTIARTVVPDAYVQQFDTGMGIQMGAFNSKSDAQSLVDRLKQEGIQSSIYRP